MRNVSIYEGCKDRPFQDLRHLSTGGQAQCKPAQNIGRVSHKETLTEKIKLKKVLKNMTFTKL
jgi:hypothetical protein